jgi:plastocyanin
MLRIASLNLGLLLALSSSLPSGAEEIHGTVIIKQRLTRKRVTAAADGYARRPAVPFHSDLKDDPLAAERARVVIYVDGPGALDPAGSHPVPAIEQKDRRFVPELLVVSAGSAVSFPNLDPVFHNVFSLSKPKSFDLGNYPKDQTRTVALTRPGIEFVNCHLHPNMSATIVVTPNEWHATADRAGRFTLHNVPAGPRTIVAWHKAAGSIRQNVDVVPGRGATVEFFVPIGDDPPRKLEARR